MKVKEALQILKKNKKFTDWSKKHKNFFLVNAFIMTQDSDKINKIQLGYCNKKEEITSFIVDSKSITQFSDKEIAKFPNSKIIKIDVKNIKIDVIDALKNANDYQKAHYPATVVNKKILILQNEGKGEFWRISFMTNSLEVLHFNIDSNSGELLMHKKSSLLQFGGNVK